MKFNKHLQGFLIGISCLLFFPIPIFGGNIKKGLGQSDSIYIQNLVDIAWHEVASDIDCAVSLATDAVDLSKAIGFQKGLADGLHCLGAIHRNQSDLPNALNYFLEALDIRLKINDQLGLGRSYNNIGSLYFIIGQYDTALVYYEKAHAIRHSLQDTFGLVYSLTNIGDIHLKNKHLEEAFSYYKQSEQLAIHSKDPSKLSHAKGKLGDFILEKGYPKRARLYWEEALKLAEKSKNNRQIATALCTITKLELHNTDSVKLGDLRVMASRALIMARRIKNSNIEGEAVLLLAEIAKTNGNFKAASQYKQDYQKIMSSIWVNQESMAIDKVMANFQSRKYTRELIDKEEKLSLQLSRLWLLLLVMSCVIIVILIVNYRRRYSEQVKLMDTIRKEMEKVAEKNKALQQSNEVLEKFAFAASHDLKEPLRNIGAFTDLLNRRNKGVLSEESKDYIDFISDATHQMHQVLDDLLDFARLTHPPLKAMQTTKMSKLFTNWIHQNQALLESNNVHITMIDTLPIIRAYPSLIADLINHLFSNAIKFHRMDASIQIKIDYQLNKHEHIFSIEDNGIGIDLAYRKKIFETFQRLNKQHFTGTGMGLALCKRIIKHHNGRIWFKSEEGQGSCFYFSIKRHSNDILPDIITHSYREYGFQSLSL